MAISMDDDVGHQRRSALQRGGTPRSAVGSHRGQLIAVRALSPWVGWAARAAIVGRNWSRADPTRGRFTRSDVRRLLQATWTRFDHLAPDVPPEPTAGSRQNVLLAALTLAMFEALLDEGVERSYAVELVGDACWVIYRQWGMIPKFVSRLLTRDAARKMRLSVEMFLHFPFNRPGYVYDDLPEPEGRALDMLRCPVADYLAAHSAADLAVGSWCNLDFQLARMWGGTLERHGSLAGGAPRCDFRFRANPGSLTGGSARSSTPWTPLRQGDPAG